jgi:hypothetical protein
MPWSGNVETIGYPFARGVAEHIKRNQYLFDTTGNRILAVTGHLGFLMSCKLDGSELELLPRMMHENRPVDQIESIVDTREGFLVIAKCGLVRIAGHYDFTTRSCRTFDLGQVSKSNVIRWSYHEASHHVIGASQWRSSEDWAYAIDLQSGRSFDLSQTETRAIFARRRLSKHNMSNVEPTFSLPIYFAPDKLPTDSLGILFDRVTGRFDVRTSEGEWNPFFPDPFRHRVSIKRPILHADCKGGSLVILSEDSSAQRSLWFFAFPDGECRRVIPVGPKESGFALSNQGDRILRRVGRTRFEWHDLGTVSPPQVVVSNQTTTSRPVVSIGRCRLVIQNNEYSHVLTWELGHLSARHTNHPQTRLTLMKSLEPFVVKASRHGVFVPDTRRFMEGCRTPYLNVLVDCLGQVVLLDQTNQVVAYCFMSEANLTIALADGTSLDVSAIYPRTEVHGRIARILLAAESGMGVDRT